MSLQDEARQALATMEAERDQHPDAYWVGWLQGTIKHLITQAEGAA